MVVQQKCLLKPDYAWLMTLRDEDPMGGFLTPATAMGDRLIKRLSEHAGMTFTVD